MRNKQNAVNNLRRLSPLPFLLFSLFFFLSSCDLFTGPKADLLQTISDEFDWESAPKLAVRIEYPSAWGTSNPQQGSITPAKDIRKGYEFSVEFIPEMSFTLHSWQAYLTSDLDELGNWLEFPELIKPDNIKPLVGSDEITLPDASPRGGTFNFTILTTRPVTLVPWCDTEPRITRTVPDNNTSGDLVLRTSDIVLYFNGALDSGTINFAANENADGIWITAKALNGDGKIINNNEKHWYDKPVFKNAGGFFTVTMPCIDTAPDDSLMTVTVKGIKNTQGKVMDGKYSFSWKTLPSLNVNLKSYSAVYTHNESANSGIISVTFDQTGADKLKTYYRLNNGNDISLKTIEKIDNSIAFPLTVDSEKITGPNYTGVREGRQAVGIGEYEISIELYKDEIMANRTAFKIWNIPGMSVSNANPVIEVADPAALENLALNDEDKQYVLASDISVSTAWTPIGNSGAPFKGKFYGNGHTITLNSGFNGDGDLGLFGYAEGATIRDLTLVYNAPEINVAASISTPYEMYQANINPGDPPNEGSVKFNFKSLRVGGLAGHLTDSEVSNIITSGGIIKVKSKPIGGFVTIQGIGTFDDGGVLLGGIAGYVEGGTIKNCRAALSTQFTSGGSTLLAITSAIAGVAIGGGSIEKVTIAANVNANVQDMTFGVAGGAVGVSRGNTLPLQVNNLKDITFTAGTVSSSGDSMISVCAGIAGMSSMVTMENCSFLGDITTNTNADAQIGGLIGNNETNSGRISNCWVQGNINHTGNGSITIGGFLGVSKNRGTFTIENCSFNGGNITVKATNVTETNERRPDIGGFCGSIGGKLNPPVMNNCGVLSGTITVNAIGILRVGGFISYTEGNISDSFSRMDIVVESNSTSACRIGGFTGMLTTGSKIERCFATGTVSVVTVSTNSPADGGNLYGRPSAGGLVGTCQGTITNSYALGNVVASDIGNFGPTYAGGLVGRVDGGSISNCFSAGQVSASSEKISAYSGGIAGDSKVSISNTAALGKSVTALSPPSGTVNNPSPPNPSNPISPVNYSRSVGRIMGNVQTGVNNYALDTMAIEEDAYYATNPPSRAANSGLNTNDGEDVASSAFFRPSFWNTTLGFNNNTWDFNRVATDGYPRLKDVGGQ